MAEHPCTEERFLNDVREHEMTVIKDDGVYRHLRFGRVGDSCYHFHIHTFPGGLLYTGDMGTYVFQRTEDMFEFFRTDREYAKERGRQLYINIGYWTEKLVAVDGNRGGGKVKVFDEEKFRKVINEYRVSWMRSSKEAGTLDKEERRELWQAVQDDVLNPAEDGEHQAFTAAQNFCHYKRGHDFRGPNWQFDDFWEHDLTEYTHSILWCLYALSWSIQVYDDFKAKQARLMDLNDYDLMNRRDQKFGLPEGLTMEDLDGEAERRNMKCQCCGTIEHLYLDLGSGGPYRCNSTDCMVF